jgi:hypothetical protein
VPVRRRLTALRDTAVDPISCFRWSAGGDGLDHLLGQPHFRTEAEARHAWQRVRRAVWSRAYRFTVPDPAAHFDGLTMHAHQTVLWSWNHVGPYDLTAVLAGLKTDHANLLAFERTKGARSIPDYLSLLRSDLATIEQTARRLAASAAPYWQRACPYHVLVTAARYGDGDANREG